MAEKVRNLVVLGSTGSIGRNTLRVVEALGHRVRVVGLAVNRRYDLALAQAQRFNVKHIAVADLQAAERCGAEAPSSITVHKGPDGLERVATLEEADLVVCGLVGMAALRSVWAAIEHGIDVALATKEVLVAAGGLLTEACRKHGSRLLPVDSEHSAILQCLGGRLATDPNSALARSEVRRLILTASGGPFAGRKDIDLETVTVDQALSHPRWRMGKKVTIDSATLMNKGLEVMEASWLFGIPEERIDVVIHPESIVHSMVEFVDGSVLAQMSPPDMRYAIQFALTYPEHVATGLPSLDIVRVGTLHFEQPDERRFPCLVLAREAARRGGTLPAVLNASNEVAVERFLGGEISFPGIWELVAKVMAAHRVTETPDLVAIWEADQWARRTASSLSLESAGRLRRDRAKAHR